MSTIKGRQSDASHKLGTSSGKPTVNQLKKLEEQRIKDENNKHIAKIKKDQAKQLKAVQKDTLKQLETQIAKNKDGFESKNFISSENKNNLGRF